MAQVAVGISDLTVEVLLGNLPVGSMVALVLEPAGVGLEDLVGAVGCSPSRWGLMCQQLTGFVVNAIVEKHFEMVDYFGK